jgi:hypothetical protein
MQDDNRINFENWDFAGLIRIYFFALDMKINEKLVFQ